MRIMLYTQNERKATVVKTAIETIEYVLDIVDRSNEIYEMVHYEYYDLIVLVIESFDDGNLLKLIRKIDMKTPIIVLVPQMDSDIGIGALDDGADDYLVWPFRIEEFQARVRVLLRRGSNQSSSLLQLGPLELNMSTRLCTLDNKTVDLTSKERGILEILLMCSEQIISKDKIMSHMYSIQNTITPSIIETYISRLRKKLDHKKLEIKTIYGEGYMLRETEEGFQETGFV